MGQSLNAYISLQKRTQTSSNLDCETSLGQGLDPHTLVQQRMQACMNTDWKTSLLPSSCERPFHLILFPPSPSLHSLPLSLSFSLFLSLSLSLSLSLFHHLTTLFTFLFHRNARIPCTRVSRHLNALGPSIRRLGVGQL